MDFINDTAIDNPYQITIDITNENANENINDTAKEYI